MNRRQRIITMFMSLVILPAGASAGTWVQIDRPFDPWGFQLGLEHSGINAQPGIGEEKRPEQYLRFVLTKPK